MISSTSWVFLDLNILQKAGMFLVTLPTGSCSSPVASIHLPWTTTCFCWSMSKVTFWYMMEKTSLPTATLTVVGHRTLGLSRR